MTSLTEALAALEAARETVFGHFGVKDNGFALTDFTEHPWYFEGSGEVLVWPQGTVVIDPADGDYEDAEQGGELWGKSQWATDEFTLITVVVNNHEREVWVLRNSNRTFDLTGD